MSRAGEAGADEALRESEERFRVEAVGRSMSLFYADEDSGLPEELLREAAAAGRAERKHWAVRKDGSRFRADVVVTALHDSAGRLLGFAKVVRDVTAPRELEQFRDELVQMLVHDLRAPLPVIAANLGFLRADLADRLDDRTARHVDDAALSCGRVVSMVNDLLDVSRLESGDLAFTPRDTDLGARRPGGS